MGSRTKMTLRGRIREILSAEDSSLKKYRNFYVQQFSITISKRFNDYIWLTVHGRPINKQKLVIGREVEVEFFIQGELGEDEDNGLNILYASKVKFLSEKDWLIPKSF